MKSKVPVFSLREREHVGNLTVVLHSIWASVDTHKQVGEEEHRKRGRERGRARLTPKRSCQQDRQ